MESRVKVAVFDLDGTLIDSAPDIHAAANAVLAELGVEPLTLEMARGFVGAGAPVFVERMMEARALPATPEHHARLLERFIIHYHRAVGLTRPYPQALATLQALLDAGWQLGLCTNKPLGPTQAVLDHLDMTRFFSVVTGGDSLAQRKPDPVPLHHTLARLGAERALFVGDSEVDAQTAHAAALPFALFTRGYRKASVESLRPAFAFDDHGALREWCLSGAAARAVA